MIATNTMPVSTRGQVCGRRIHSDFWTVMRASSASSLTSLPRLASGNRSDTRRARRSMVETIFSGSRLLYWGRAPRPLTAEEEAESYACFDTEDFREGVRAFLAKETPRFKGK